VQKIVTGGFYTCIIRSSNGRVYCWGRGFWGPLGYGNEDTIGATNSPLSGGEVNDTNLRAIDIAAGYFHVCALYEDTSVRCWGKNEYGQIGHNTTLVDYIGVTDVPADHPVVPIGTPVRTSCPAITFPPTASPTTPPPTGAPTVSPTLAPVPLPPSPATTTRGTVTSMQDSGDQQEEDTTVIILIVSLTILVLCVAAAGAAAAGYRAKYMDVGSKRRASPSIITRTTSSSETTTTTRTASNPLTAAHRPKSPRRGAVSPFVGNYAKIEMQPVPIPAPRYDNIAANQRFQLTYATTGSSASSAPTYDSVPQTKPMRSILDSSSSEDEVVGISSDYGELELAKPVLPPLLPQQYESFASPLSSKSTKHRSRKQQAAQYEGIGDTLQ